MDYLSKEHIDTLEFKYIKDIWDHQLWVGRDNKPVSSMTFDGNYEMKVYDHTWSRPSFFAYFVDHFPVAVNSGHRVSETEYRSRGLWVDPKHRNKGIATVLLAKTIQQARMEGCRMIWSLPREQALNTYLRAGFVQDERPEQDLDFAKNYYVYKNLEVTECRP